jgi:hypothetical protein
MRSVKSLSQATKAAAQSGATLEVGGRLVNAGGAKLSVVKPTPAVEPEAPVAPTVEPAPTPAPMPVVDRAAAFQTERFTAVMHEVLQTLQVARTEPEPRPMPIAFDVERDSQGLLTRIVPVYP